MVGDPPRRPLADQPAGPAGRRRHGGSACRAARDIGQRHTGIERQKGQRPTIDEAGQKHRDHGRGRNLEQAPEGQRLDARRRRLTAPRQADRQQRQREEDGRPEIRPEIDRRETGHKERPDHQSDLGDEMIEAADTAPVLHRDGGTQPGFDTGEHPRKGRPLQDPHNRPAPRVERQLHDQNTRPAGCCGGRKDADITEQDHRIGRGIGADHEAQRISGRNRPDQAGTDPESLKAERRHNTEYPAAELKKGRGSNQRPDVPIIAHWQAGLL